jgi:thymidylate synthase (FAD)
MNNDNNNRIYVAEFGYVELRNLSGPTRRPDEFFDADDIDPPNAARFSFDAADKVQLRENDLKLADYLMRNQHWSPFEMIECWFVMKLPIFIARQFVRHRTVSLNEVSARYTKLKREFYIPNFEEVGTQCTDNKQGRDISKECDYADTWRSTLKHNCNAAFDAYELAIANGVPNEIARIGLPLNIYTTWLWKQNLRNVMHFLSLRLHDHAQYEARVYARAVEELLNRNLPNCMELFNKYKR